MDLTEFCEDVGHSGAVTITGCGSRGGAVDGVRTVRAPAGIEWIQADEMTVSCGAGTTLVDLSAALGEVGQRVALPVSGTVGGALAVGESGIRRLGDGPVRDVLLQATYVSAAGEIVTAGGPTVKNVSGFDVCRVLVGSRGTLGFVGATILRTRPLPAVSRWFVTERDPWEVFGTLYRPISVLWNGASTWVLLEGHAADVHEQAVLAGLSETSGPPALPEGGRHSMAPGVLRSLAGGNGFVAEIGVGVVHRVDAAPAVPADPALVALHRRIKNGFDPGGRLNPGVSVNCC